MGVNIGWLIPPHSSPCSEDNGADVEWLIDKSYFLFPPVQVQAPRHSLAFILWCCCRFDDDGLTLQFYCLLVLRVRLASLGWLVVRLFLFFVLPSDLTGYGALEGTWNMDVWQI